MFTRVRHRFLTWATWIQSTTSQPIFLRSIQIFSSHLRLGLGRGLFPSGFPAKILYIYLSHKCYKLRPPNRHWLDHSNNIWWRVQVMKLLILKYPKKKWCGAWGIDEMYGGVTKSFRNGRRERELQMVQLSATRCICIAILWVSLVSFAAISVCVASQRVFIVVVYFVMTQSGNFWIRPHTCYSSS
jgi:hypothetical protein